MSFDGNGTFLRIMNWAADAASGIKIKSDRHDQQDDDFATGLSNTITKDGQSQPTNDIPMNTHRIINAGDPINDQDLATKKYADTIKPSTSGFVVSGADGNGRLTFSSLTGVNGLSWTGADMSWVARLATAAGPGTPPVPPATLNRLCLNDKADTTGTDVVVFNDDGSGKLIGAFSTGGAITAGGSVIATSTLGTKAAAGNVHVWWYGPANEDRGVIYTNAAAAGSLFLRTSGQALFEFNNSSQFRANGAVFSGASYLGTDGNVSGSATIWANWGYQDAYSAINARIEARAQAWAASFQNNCVTNTDCAGEVSTAFNVDSGSIGKQQWAGYFCSGVMKSGSTVYMYFRMPRRYIANRGWEAAFPF